MNPPVSLRAVFTSCFFALFFVSGRTGFAETQLVDSIAALQAKIATASAGDTVVLKNGTYSANAAITVRCSGVDGQPITLMAESIGGVEITGTQGFKIAEPAAYVVVAGFKFTNTAGKTAIADGTSHVRFTANTFLCPGDGADLTVAGDDAEVDFNEFGPKKSSGAMIAVSGTGTQVARRLWIHHNHFHDFDNDGASGAEMIRFGLLNAHRLSSGAGLVEHNLFVRCRGVNDLISNRSSGNTYRFNTFLDSPTSHLTLRQGNDCVVAGNYFHNTEGVRIYGDRHQVFSNYLEGNYVGINLGNGDVELAESADAPASSHDRPDDCVIAFNTLIDNGTHYQMSRRASGALGATNAVFANNILIGGKLAAKIDGPNAGAVWSGNLVWETAAVRDLPDEGYAKADPALAAGADGIKRPQPGSPAVESAVGGFPNVTFDLEGRSRPAKKTKGAEELGDAPSKTPILSERDVGPKAWKATTPTPPSIPAAPAPTEKNAPPATETPSP